MDISFPISIAGFTKNAFWKGDDVNQTVAENNVSFRLGGFPDSTHTSYYFVPVGATGDTAANASGVVVSNSSTSFKYYSSGLLALEFLSYVLDVTSPEVTIPILAAEAFAQFAGYIGSKSDVVCNNGTTGNGSIFQRSAITMGTYHGNWYTNSSSYYVNSYYTQEMMHLQINTPAFKDNGNAIITAKNLIGDGTGPTLSSPSIENNVYYGAEGNLSIPIMRANTLTGIVKNNNIVANNVTVKITQEDPGSGFTSYYYVNTDKSGNYRFFFEPGMNYEVQEVLPGGLSNGISGYINLDDYNTTVADLNISYPSITGKVTNSTVGAGIPNESVLVTNTSGFSNTYKTDSNGIFSTSPLLSGTYSIDVENSVKTTLSVKTGQFYVENFALSPDAIQGWVKDSSGSMVGNALVTLAINGMTFSTRSSSSGSYSFNNVVYTGTANIAVSYYTETVSSSLNIPNIYGTTYTDDIQTSPAGAGSSDTIAGYVSNPSGSAASGASITIDSQNSLSTTTTNTDLNGHYSFSGITGTGTYYISISLNGYHGYYTPDVTSISGITYSSSTALQSVSPDTISGTITSYTGADASGASVTLAFDGTTRTTTANSSGHYSFGNIYDTGKYYIDATYDSEPGSGSKIVSAIDGQTLTVNIQTAAPVQGGCVLNGTLITVSQNKAIPVQDLSTGSKILSYDTADGKLVEEKVTGINVTNVTSIFNIDNGLLYVSGATDQPIYVMLPNGTTEWIMVGSLNTTDMIFDPVNNSWIPVNSFQINYGNFTVYDLNGSKIFTSGGYERSDYIANGILLDVKKL